MRKLILFLVLFSSPILASAQDINNGWPQRQDREQIIIDPDGQNITIDHNTYGWIPFDDVIGVSIYGSRYRKAKDSKNWGVFLSVVAAPASALYLAYGIDQAIYCDSGFAHAIIGAVALAGSLGGGIHLWVKGRRELDWMLDDYAERYSPKPIAASLTFGPTMNGFGLAYNF